MVRLPGGCELEWLRESIVTEAQRSVGHYEDERPGQHEAGNGRVGIGYDRCQASQDHVRGRTDELDLDPDDWDWGRVGKAVFSGLARVVREIDDGGSLTSEYSVWLHEKGAAAELLVQLEERTPGTSIHELSLEAEGDGWRLKFERRFAEATAGMERRLSGASYRD